MTTDSDFLVDPQTYNYWNASFVKNGAYSFQSSIFCLPDLYANAGGKVVYHEGDYSTDVVAEKGLAAIDLAAVKPDTPFFIGSESTFERNAVVDDSTTFTHALPVAPIAPHSHITGVPSDIGGILFDVPQSAERHKDLFKNVTLDYSRASHNPDHPSGVSWVRVPSSVVSDCQSKRLTDQILWFL